MSAQARQRRIVIVGGLAAGPSAAAKAARVNPRALVTMLEAGRTVSYGICEAPYAVAGLIPDEGVLAPFTPERLRQEKGIDVRILHKAETIHPTKRTITVRDLARQSFVELDYDALVLATGATPRRLGLPGEDARNVFHVSTRDDTRNILGYLAAETPSHAVIVGGGYIGMEMADALRTRGLDVTLVHRHRLPMAKLEDRTREAVFDELERNGVHFVTNASVKALPIGKDGRVTHVTANRGTFESGIVILALGVEPNVALARTAKVRLGPTGAIAVDERQQTNIDGIYAAGDCAEVRNAVTGLPIHIPLATVASRTGWVAGENAAGGRARFTGAIRAAAVGVFSLEVAQVGVSADEARRAKLSVVTETITARNAVKAMPHAADIHVTLIAESPSGRLLGANVWGAPGAVLRANTLGVAIQRRMTVGDVARFDMIYAPPFAPLWDPVLVAANQLLKKL
jgi:NADPH-dependent 2,4-dienoyl-CoA reductase/sulfur reductase-like enzyme